MTALKVKALSASFEANWLFSALIFNVPVSLYKGKYTTPTAIAKKILLTTF